MVGKPSGTSSSHSPIPAQLCSAYDSGVWTAYRTRDGSAPRWPYMYATAHKIVLTPTSIGFFKTEPNLILTYCRRYSKKNRTCRDLSNIFDILDGSN
jgi:hypothetical protein